MDLAGCENSKRYALWMDVNEYVMSISNNNLIYVLCLNTSCKQKIQTKSVLENVLVRVLENIKNIHLQYNLGPQYISSSSVCTDSDQSLSNYNIGCISSLLPR